MGLILLRPAYEFCHISREPLATNQGKTPATIGFRRISCMLPHLIQINLFQGGQE
ncbi:MAG: hypothetical protein J7578_22755 [Chitinophagaceae bacterium]|nr:hypothetical protein [Chitinophagaceae bacterium]